MVANRFEKSQIVAVEPDPNNYRALCEGILINHFRNITALNLAAWNEKAQLEFYLSTSAQHSLKERKSSHILVEAIPGDSLPLSGNRVACIKIDVEGAEAEVIQGLHRTIGRYRPIIIFESKLALEMSEVAYLRELGYTFRVMDKSGSAWNCVAVPQLNSESSDKGKSVRRKVTRRRIR
jgi:FkbM family methyltransferase